MSDDKPPSGEVAALIERLRVIENKPREPDACTNLYPPDYIVECREGLRKAIEALARLSAPVPAREWISDEPTDEMIKYGLQAMMTNNVHDSSEQGRIKRIWQAMYNRRPDAP